MANVHAGATDSSMEFESTLSITGRESMTDMPDVEKVSAVEGFKSESDYLLGDIGTELGDDEDFFGKGSIQLLKHHGTYQQDDRDV